MVTNKKSYPLRKIVLSLSFLQIDWKQKNADVFFVSFSDDISSCFLKLVRKTEDEFVLPNDRFIYYRMSLHVLIGISIVACFSVTLNIALVYMYWKRERRKEHRYRQPRCRASSHTFLFHSDSEVLDTDSSNEIVELRESSPSITGMQKSKLIDRNGLARS